MRLGWSNLRIWGMQYLKFRITWWHAIVDLAHVIQFLNNWIWWWNLCLVCTFCSAFRYFQVPNLDCHAIWYFNYQIHILQCLSHLNLWLNTRIVWHFSTPSHLLLSLKSFLTSLSLSLIWNHHLRRVVIKAQTQLVKKKKKLVYIR